MGIFCMAQETQTGALYQPRGVEWGERWEGGSKGRLIHVEVGQYTAKFCKAILSFNKKNKIYTLSNSFKQYLSGAAD